MNNMPKLLIFAGVALIIVGLIWMVLGRFIQLGKLPGDIYVDRGNFKFYFPIVTCIVISLILTLISWIIRHFMK
ncbi:DUF2905 domain-containing protein [Paenibacillus urinalis]|uniref:DUF2905 domain-containing protein n=1 Tax=Paenibacillus urinalis TaxID=521520 RepID=A0AAX3MV43_9BACL|nr:MULTISPECIES: DUF2905 domain-containing protein [Paenibacillus]WDH81490.1 DUF2905 domain-containing protein [Paenibacillus urinalis]WDH97539.1 DUF2905 domain-containing protein [Paenibacillus urinalis]WDI01206.1 DUF2905 domain-containing protein [Paenibacillus urinalis]GAK39735.1 hypothetical protein TCA2_2224 [Paenibacillus sp. TCA20]